MGSPMQELLTLCCFMVLPTYRMPERLWPWGTHVLRCSTEQNMLSRFFSRNSTRRFLSFFLLRNFTRQARNMFGYTRHAPTAISGNYSKKHNKVIKIGFIKPCDVRMDGEFTYSMGCTSTCFSCIITLYIISKCRGTHSSTLFVKSKESFEKYCYFLWV